MLFKSYDQLNISQRSQAEDIFFETSSIQSFKSLEEKDQFLFKYFGYFAQKYPELFTSAVDQEGNVLGYICGHQNLLNDTFLLNSAPYYSLFKDELKHSPSCLHINLTSSARGLGLGKRLIGSWLELLKAKGSEGVHVIVLKGEPNIEFYKKMGFSHICTKEFSKSHLQLMALKL